MKNLLELSKKNIPSYGIYITMQDPQLIEMAKCAGYDFGRLDAEHVNFSPQTLAEMFRMARLLDFPLQIRVGSRENIDPILALEPSAVMFPDVQTKSDAERIVEHTQAVGRRALPGLTIKRHVGVGNGLARILVHHPTPDGVILGKQLQRQQKHPAQYA